MGPKGRGYAGDILYVNLADGTHRTSPLDENVARLLLGGKGIGIWLLFKLTKANVDPLSPHNPLILATGPLTGTLAPCSGRFCVVTKSPATWTVVDSYCGGFLGPELKFAGYDALVLEGQAEIPSVLVIDDDNITLRPAGDVWGRTTAETERALEDRLGKGYRFAEIGPAGERKAPIASILSSSRSAGRGGVGAVMGSKKLKAIAVKGSKPIRVHDPNKFKEMSWVAYRALRMNEVTVRSLPTYGTANILLTINETGALPTRNFQTGRFEDAERISGESFHEEIWKKDFACSLGCTIKCSKIARIERGRYKGTAVDGPDYETIFSLGSNCGVGDKTAITHANLLCDLYGMDTISVGDVIAFVMELYENGVVTVDELMGIEAKWGDPNALVNLTEKIGRGEGIGEFLQLGVKRISDKYPAGSRFAMHVKGLELPGYEPRAAQGMALCYAISERGGCHLRAYTAGMELCGYRGGADPLTYDRSKVQLAIDQQDEKAVVDSAVICFFTLFGMRLKEVYQMINPCTGFGYRETADVKLLGERVITLARMFNVREGFTKKDDVLPLRSLEEPLPEGPARGQVAHLEPMLMDYYELRGWDEDGIPTEGTLRELELDALIG